MVSARREELLACPACSGDLRFFDAGSSCTNCGATFEAKGGVLRLRQTRSDERTERVRQFYTAAPFPGYRAKDTLGTIRARAERSDFARLLDRAVAGDARIVEVGCGTGTNFPAIRRAIGNSGELIGVECSEPMLRKARENVRRSGWSNVHVVDREYGWSTVTRGEAAAVLFSYSLSMIPDWQAALNCAREELRDQGRIGIVDFCSAGKGQAASVFAGWMSWNHVDVLRGYRHVLDRHFRSLVWARHRVLRDAWCYFRYVGSRCNTGRS